MIIDEAHNLSDTLSCIYSSELTGAQVHTYRIHISGANDAFPNVWMLPQLCRAHSQLTQYTHRFKWVQIRIRNNLHAALAYKSSCMFLFVRHQEQAQGEEPYVHQADSLCDWGAHPGAGRWMHVNHQDLDSPRVTLVSDSHCLILIFQVKWARIHRARPQKQVSECNIESQWLFYSVFSWAF